MQNSWAGGGSKVIHLFGKPKNSFATKIVRNLHPCYKSGTMSKSAALTTESTREKLRALGELELQAQRLRCLYLPIHTNWFYSNPPQSSETCVYALQALSFRVNITLWTTTSSRHNAYLSSLSAVPPSKILFPIDPALPLYTLI